MEDGGRGKGGRGGGYVYDCCGWGWDGVMSWHGMFG